jgi:hypothetical protein
MLNDLRFARRMIASRRWFSAAVVVTLALGIGLNTMVFTLINAALYKAVPVPGGDRFVAISGRNQSQDNRAWEFPIPISENSAGRLLPSNPSKLRTEPSASSANSAIPRAAIR